MILAAGLTPAWQQIMLFRSFHYGEVNRATEVHWLSQGKVLNVGIAAHHLGGPSLTLSPLGGPAMEQIDREFASLGIPHRWIVTRSATRVCTTILDQTTHQMTELVENGRPLLPEELNEYRQAYAEEAARASTVVLTGSLPTGTPSSYYRELLERTPCPAVLDFRGEGLANCLDLKPLVIKPNREELGHTVGCQIENDSQLLEAMRSLNRRGAQWVVITQGGGPVWLTSTTETYCLTPFPVDNIVNPIGCGDSMAAGIAWAIREGRSMVEAVRFGMATAVQNARRLDTGRVDAELASQEAAKIEVTQP